MKDASLESFVPFMWEEEAASARTLPLPSARQFRPVRTVPPRLVPFGTLFFGILPVLLGLAVVRLLIIGVEVWVLAWDT